MVHITYPYYFILLWTLYSVNLRCLIFIISPIIPASLESVNQFEDRKTRAEPREVPCSKLCKKFKTELGQKIFLYFYSLIHSQHTLCHPYLDCFGLLLSFLPSCHFLKFISQGHYPAYLIWIINPFSMNLILHPIYNLSSVQQILNNKNVSFNSISSWRTEKIKTSIGLVSIISPWAHGDSVNHKMNSHPVTAVPTNKQKSGPNRLLKLTDDFMITDINSRKCPHIYLLIIYEKQAML